MLGLAELGSSRLTAPGRTEFAQRHGGGWVAGILGVRRGLPGRFLDNLEGAGVGVAGAILCLSRKSVAVHV